MWWPLQIRWNGGGAKIKKGNLWEVVKSISLGFSYNLKVYIELQNRINESTLVCARPGELFAKVPLEGQLSEDTDAGKLILTSVFQVLVAPHNTDGRMVYEAVIVQKENFNFDGKGKDYIYLCLSPRYFSPLYDT